MGASRPYRVRVRGCPFIGPSCEPCYRKKFNRNPQEDQGLGARHVTCNELFLTCPICSQPPNLINHKGLEAII